MSTTVRRRDRALERSERAIADAGGQIRLARRGSGVSLRAAAASVGLDFGLFSRIERNRAENVTVRQLALACAAVGLDLGVRTFFAGDATRDAGQLRLLERLHNRLARSVPWATEVPMPIQGDLRALDALTRLEGRSIGIEAEARLGDIQAVERKALLKQRDAELNVLLLLVADTRGNRDVLRLHREALRPSFPLDTRAVMRALAAGRAPAANGIVVL